MAVHRPSSLPADTPKITLAKIFLLSKGPHGIHDVVLICACECSARGADGHKEGEKFVRGYFPVRMMALVSSVGLYMPRTVRIKVDLAFVEP